MVIRLLTISSICLLISCTIQQLQSSSYNPQAELKKVSVVTQSTLRTIPENLRLHLRLDVLLQEHNNPISVWINEPNKRIYKVDENKDILTIVDKYDEFPYQLSTVKVGKNPVGVVATGDNSRIFVTNMKDASVSVIHGASRQVEKVINLGYEPLCIVLGQEEKALYVATRLGDRVFTINTTSLELKGVSRIDALDLSVRMNRCFGACHEAKRQRLLVSLQQSATKP